MNNQFLKEIFQKDTSSSLEKFSSATRLLKQSWEIYCSRIKTLIGITAIPVVFSLLTELIIPSKKTSIEFFILGMMFFLTSVFLWLLVTPTLIFSIKENLDLKQSYKKGFKILTLYLWVATLKALIIFAGFILLIIPGFIFSIWFSLAGYILIFEQKRGMSALWRSKDLVSGKFWKVLWRFLVFGVIIFIIAFSLGFLIGLFRNEQLSDIFGSIFGLFITPFSVIYGILIYKNLAEIKDQL